MNSYYLEVYGSNSYKYRDVLKDEHFKFNKRAYGNSFWEKKINKEELDYYKEVCKFYNFRFKVIDPNFKRSGSYIDIYFQNKKALLGKYYLCAYCQKVLRKEEVTIDHIFPVSRTSRSKFLIYICHCLKINNINDYRNLVCCCKSCNSRKQSKVGKWTILGFLGKTNIGCIILKTIKIILVLLILKYLYRYMINIL